VLPPSVSSAFGWLIEEKIRKTVATSQERRIKRLAEVEDGFFHYLKTNPKEKSASFDRCPGEKGNFNQKTALESTPVHVVRRE
jgi:hypothetical protein